MVLYNCIYRIAIIRLLEVTTKGREMQILDLYSCKNGPLGSGYFAVSTTFRTFFPWNAGYRRAPYDSAKCPFLVSKLVVTAII